MTTLLKDPDAELDYTWQWQDWLEDGDTITSAEVFTDDTPTVGTVTFDDTSVTAWVSGGTVGDRARLTCRVGTAGGRTEDRSEVLFVTER